MKNVLLIVACLLLLPSLASSATGPMANQSSQGDPVSDCLNGSVSFFSETCRGVHSEGATLNLDPLTQPADLSLTPGPRPYSRTNLFKRVFTDQAYLITTWWPAEVRRVRFTLPLVLAFGGASGSGSGRGTDLELQRSLEGWTTGDRRKVATVFTRLGDAESSVMLLGASYLISRLTGNSRLRRTTSLSAEAMFNTAIYSSILKKTMRRTRPSNGGTGEFWINRPGNGVENTSFPSGHAMGAFAMATVVASEYQYRRWVPWVAYGTASLISLSRVQLGRHFPSDILAGAVIGRSLGKMVIERGGTEREIPFAFRFQPYYDAESDGIGLAYSHSW